MRAKSNPVACAFALIGVLLAYLAAARAEQGTDAVTTVSVPGGGQPLSAKCDAEGTIHLIYDSADGPQYVKSADNGTTFSLPIAVVDPQSRRPGLEFEGWDFVIGKGGRVHVAMSTNAWKLKLPQEEWAFFYAHLDPGAQSFSPLKNLNRKPSEGFSLAADDQGNVTACWLSGKLYANVSRDNGESFAAAVEIDPQFDPCDCCTTSSAYGADGRLAVLYREETNNERDMYLVLWDQRSNQASRRRISTTLWKIAGCPMSYYTVSRARDGYLAIWPTEGQIYFARLNSQGVLLSPEEIKTPGTTGMRTGMLTLTDAASNTLVAWKKEGRLGWQIYDGEGRAVARPGGVESAGSGVAGVLTIDGRFLLFR